MSAATGLRYLGHVAAINGNVITLCDVRSGVFVRGLRIVADDDRLGRSPRCGSAVVQSADDSIGTVTVDSAATLGICAKDFLFEAPPTETELIERRLAALEQAVEPPRWARERFAEKIANTCPHSANTCPHSGHTICLPIGESGSPRPDEPRAPSFGSLLHRARIRVARAIDDDNTSTDRLTALSDALRAVEGR